MARRRGAKFLCRGGVSFPQNASGLRREGGGLAPFFRTPRARTNNKLSAPPLTFSGCLTVPPMRSTPQKRSAELPPFVFGAPQPAAKRSTPSGLDSSQRVSLPSASAAAAPAEYDDTYDFDEDVCDTRVYASFLYEGGAVGLALYAAASGVLATTSSVAPTESDAVWLMTMFKEQVATPEVIVARCVCREEKGGARSCLARHLPAVCLPSSPLAHSSLAVPLPPCTSAVVPLVTP